MTAEDGKIVLAALDSTPAVRGVLQTALGLAPMVGAEVEALHVTNGHDRGRISLGATTSAGVRLHKRTGPPAERILEMLHTPRVVGAVMGVRAFQGGPRPAGGGARQVIAGMCKPVVFVPPDVQPLSTEAFTRLLVPLDGSAATSRSFLALERRFRTDMVREITVLLTLDGVMPSMLDRPSHDLPEWGRAFVDRHCPGQGRTFACRTGDPGNAVIDVATQAHSDLIVLSFGGDLDVGHGSVIREVLARAAVPVLLLPPSYAVFPDGESDELLPRGPRPSTRTRLSQGGLDRISASV